jgi:hypothetical protein
VGHKNDERKSLHLQLDKALKAKGRWGPELGVVRRNIERADTAIANPPT